MRYHRSSRNLSLLHHGGQITVRRGDHPDVDREGAFSTNALKDAFLHHAQQSYLGCQRQFTNLIEEQRAFIGTLEPAPAGAHGTGKTAFLMAEQFRVDQLRGDGATVNAEKGACCSRRTGMDSASNDFFP